MNQLKINPNSVFLLDAVWALGGIDMVIPRSHTQNKCEKIKKQELPGS